MLLKKWKVAAAGLALVSGMMLSSLAAASDEYVKDYAERVKAGDWKAMETVTVTLDEHNFTPADLTFKVGQTYKLEIRNVGKKDHYYSAEKFFRSVAWRKAMVNKQAEIKAPFFTAVEVLKGGGQLDLYFIPVVEGSYEVICTIDDHKDQGMTGILTIE